MTHQTRFLLPGSIAFFILAFVSVASAADSAVTNALSNSPSNERTIKQTLNEKTAFDFQGVPLRDALEFIANKHHLTSLIDNNALKAINLDPATTPVTMTVKDVSLRSALNLLLTQFGMAFVVNNEVLLFTSREKADSMFETHIYDVRDLIQRDYDPNATPDFDSLVDTMKSTVNPQSWDKGGGQGALSTFSDNGICALVVWQNYDGHEGIENLLQKLRVLKPLRAVNQ